MSDLKAKGFDPASRIQQLTGAGPLIESASKLRQQAEAGVTAAVTNEQGVRTQFYTLATSTVSLVEGLLGKDHALPVKLRHLRSDLIGSNHPAERRRPRPRHRPNNAAGQTAAVVRQTERVASQTERSL